MLSNKKSAIFFDRDGVLIATDVRNGKAYAIRDPALMQIDSAALPLINLFKQDNYKTVVVTNQPDVGNGLIAQEAVELMHSKLLQELPLDLIEVCYHKQGAGCNCRKPKTGMFQSAATKLNLDLSNSIMIGDRNSDIEAGNSVNCFTIFIDCGYNEPLIARPNLVVRSLTEILQRHKEIMELLIYERTKLK